VLARRVAALLPPAPAEPVLAGIAAAIAHNQPAKAPAHQLLFDVTGQVALEPSQVQLPPLLEGLLAAPFAGWRAEPVYFGEDGRWRYARAFMLRHFGCNPQLLADDVVEMRRGDSWAALAGEALPPKAAEEGIARAELAPEADAPLVWAYVAATARPMIGPRCFVDISELLRHDWQSGIQRVVKNLLAELLHRAPPGQVVVPVYTTPQQSGYRAATAYLRRLAQLPALPDAADEPIEPRAGDTFFALDLQPHYIQANAAYLAQLQAQGVRIAFMVYDLLPVQLPDCFFPGAAEHHSAWLSVVANADLAVCISQAVAHDLRGWLDANVPHAPLRDIRFIHLGADLGTRMATRGIPPDAAGLLARVREHPSFLMVGTIEPRKCHAQVLDAFELLWQRGSDAMLVISGRPGWMTEALIERLRSHPERGERLVWVEDATDELVERLYESCSALVLASRGEGFGLPLVEAAQRGLPIIVRDKPVFREVAGEHAFYFDGGGAPALADAIGQWLRLRERGAEPKSAGMPWLTWARSAEQLRRVLETP
jgi:glycosyltransferase involved in cell wall biosynthesis